MMGITKQIATAINRASEIREASYKNGEYHTPMGQAADQACEEIGFDIRMKHVVWYMLIGTWNEAQDWSKAVLADNINFFKLQ